MKVTTGRLLRELRGVVEDLVYSSESEYPIEPFVWEIAESGELTLDKLLQSEGFLRQVEIDDVFPQHLKFPRENHPEELQAEDHKQQELIDFLRSRCKSVQVYLARKNDGCDDPETEFESFPLILAETKTGEWVGIAPEVDTDFETRMNAERLLADYDPCLEKRFWESAFSYQEHMPSQNRADFYVRFDLKSLLKSLDVPLHPDLTRSTTVSDFLVQRNEAEKLLEMAAHQNEQISESTLSLAAEIKELLVGMKLLIREYYEQYWDVERFIMKTDITKELALSHLLNATGFSRICQFIEFSKEAELYDDDPEDERYTSLKPLDELFAYNLSDLREYVVGCMSIFYLYSVGRTLHGDWVGIRTVAVWT